MSDGKRFQNPVPAMDSAEKLSSANSSVCKGADAKQKPELEMCKADFRIIPTSSWCFPELSLFTEELGRTLTYVTYFCKCHCKPIAVTSLTLAL